jgi:homoserine kinase
VSRRVTVEVPASSANLGVGFDALALALDLTLRVAIEPKQSGSTELEVEGEGRELLRVDDSNRFLLGLRRGLAEAGPPDLAPAWRVEMQNQIPLARGLGSSAAATVAGLIAAGALAGAELGDDRLLALAADIEGHADNVAAALLGGFVVVGGHHARRFDPPANLRAVIFVPERQLPTADMRAVLPDVVPRADAVHNLGQAALLVSAFASGDLSLLSAMNEDRLHEPYRAALYPELPSLLAAAREAGALGAALSGAGSCVIALCTEARVASVADAFSGAARRLRLAGEARVVALRSAGGRASSRD